jgi:hypothetical protein
MNDYLGQAAALEKKLKQLIKEKQYDEAWRLTHEISEIHVKHINSVGYSKTPDVLAWAMCFSNSMAEYRAVILSKEGKHLDALVQSVWRAAVEHRPIKKYIEKMQSYLKKAKIELSPEELLKILNRTREHKNIGLLKAEFERYI